MKNLFRPIKQLLIGLILILPVSLQAALPDFTGIVDEAKDSVVNISTVSRSKAKSGEPSLRLPDIPEDSPFGELFEKFFNHDEFGGPKRDAQSLGSGFVISEDGFILTNHHVIAGADEVIVRFANREEYVAKIVGSDKASDVAVLKVDAENLTVLELGDSDDLKVGEWVLAIGSPFGFDHTVTAGIVSAKSRSLPSDNYVPFIQTDVAINPGNSGGPLFNMEGEVIGINSQIYSRTGGFMGLSFAIPIEMAVDVAQQLKETGQVSRGWLGVLIQEVTRELAESFGMGNPHGALVAKVLNSSPAEAAGLEVGDVIIEFNGKKVLRSSGLPPLVGRAKVGRDAKVIVIRNKKRKTIKVNIAELPTSTTQASFSPEKEVEPQVSALLGMKIGSLSDGARKQLKLKSGVEVTDINDEGAARDAGLQKGDVITMIDNHAIESVDDFTAVTENLESGRSVAMLIQRRSGPVFLAIRPDEDS
jgi:serine protease Do